MDKPEVNTALQRLTTTIKVTVFRSRKTMQMLFVEADKDFLDTLLSFLVLPIGTIINIVSQGIHVKSLGGISCIFDSLDSSFLRVDKSHLVQSRPAVVGCTCEQRTGVQFEEDLVTAKMMQPSNCSTPAPIGGFVKENMKYIVLDKLEIVPSSIITSMILLTKLELTAADDPESDEITVSFTQIVELLRSALSSKKCLNDVFRKN